MSGYLAELTVIFCLNLIVAYSVFLPAASGQLNLGAAGFVMIGAYSFAYMDTEGVTTVIALPIATLLAGLVGFLISFPILRTRGVYMVLATLAFAEVVAGLIRNSSTLGGEAGMTVPTHISLGLIIPSTIFVVIFGFYLMSTRVGLAMRSVHDDEHVARLFGVNVRIIQVAAFTVGGMLGGLGGALYGLHYNFIEVQHWNVLFSIYVLLYVLIGGTQTAWGPLFGALFFTAIPELLRSLGERTGEAWISDLRFVAFGIIIVLMMTVRPEGMITRTLIERLLGRGRAGRQPVQEG